jgi:aerobic carbon-monoxide dehydrogenase medium subunit
MHVTHVDNYHRPPTLAAAVELLHELGHEGHVLAGGTELLTQAGFVPHVVDITRLGLDAIRDEVRHFELGACTSLQALLEYGETRLPAILVQAARGEMGLLLRHSATVGGLLAGTRSPQDLQTALVALNATVRLQGPQGCREQPVDVFLQHRSELLCPGTLLTHVLVPHDDTTLSSHFERCAISALDTSIASVAVSISGPVDAPTAVRVAYGNVSPHAGRLHQLEALLTNNLREEALAGAPQEASAVAARTDVRASAAYRQHLVATLFRRCLEHLSPGVTS